MSTLKDIARIVAIRNRMQPQQSEEFLNHIIEVIKNGLAEDGIVKIKGLGTFKLQKVRERESVDVNTGQRVIIGSHDRISFTPDNSMKDSVNKPFSHFETVVLNDGVMFDDTPEENKDELNENFEPMAIISEDTTNTPKISDEPIVIEETNEKKVEIEEVEYSIQEENTPPSMTLLDSPNKTEDNEENKNDEIVSISNEKSNTMSTEPYSDRPFLDDEKYDNAEPEKTGFSFLKILGIIAACFVIFVAGVITGRLTTDTGLWPKWPTTLKKAIPTEVEEITDSAAIDSLDSIARINATVAAKYNKQKSAEPQKKTEEITKTESTKATTPEKKQETTPVSTTKPEQKENATPVTSSTPKLTPSQQDIYNKDARVRTGAYVITGVSQTVKVKEGQTLEGISRSYLGPGMECYVEAVNGGIKEVSAGQSIKIPELTLKKKLTQKQ